MLAPELPQEIRLVGQQLSRPRQGVPHFRVEMRLQVRDELVPDSIPDDIAARKVDVYSEGARMTGYVYTLKSTPREAKLPTIIMIRISSGGRANTV